MKYEILAPVKEGSRRFDGTMDIVVEKIEYVLEEA